MLRRPMAPRVFSPQKSEIPEDTSAAELLARIFRNAELTQAVLNRHMRVYLVYKECAKRGNVQPHLGSVTNYFSGKQLAFFFDDGNYPSPAEQRAQIARPLKLIRAAVWALSKRSPYSQLPVRKQLSLHPQLPVHACSTVHWLPHELARVMSGCVATACHRLTTAPPSLDVYNTRAKRRWEACVMSRVANGLVCKLQASLFIKGQQDIFTAASNGDLNLVHSHLITDPSAAFKKNRSGMTALHLSSIQGHAETCKLLVESKSDINARDHSQKTALHLCVDNDQVEVFRLLLAANANVDARDVEERTVLHVACLSGAMEFCRLLIESNANLDARDINNRTALHLSAENCHDELCWLLVESKADLDAKDIDDKTALHLCAEQGHAEICWFLIASKADLDAKDVDERTALHLCAEKGDVETSRLLVTSKANVDAKDRRQRSPLHFSSDQNHIDICRLLLMAKSDVNARDADQKTPLYWSSCRGHMETSRLLIKSKADINTKNIDHNRTPLHASSCSDHVEICKLLIASKADVAAKNRYGDTPLQDAIKMQSALFAHCHFEGKFPYLSSVFYLRNIGAPE